jgi:hypothetical protein
MKTSKIDEVLSEVCNDQKVIQLIRRVIDWERQVITSRNPAFKDELDVIIEEVLRK